MSTTVWVGDKMYVVDEPVRAEFDRLNDEITRVDHAFTELLDVNEQLRAKLAIVERLYQEKMQ